MDTSTYTYSALSRKYNGFFAPSCEVSIGGHAIRSGDGMLSNLEVELTADGTASGCTFTITGQYITSTSRWKDNMDRIIQIGAKLIVQIGYEKQKRIFYGFIDDYTFEWNSENAPAVHVTGVDGLAYLMNLREPYYGGKETAAQAVAKILNKSVSAGFATGVQVGALANFEAPLVKEQIDDWKFLNLMAQRHGATLMASDGQLIFDTLTASSAPILALTQNSSLTRFTKRVSMAHQVGFVEIWGRDLNQKAVKGVANQVSIGRGKAAAQIVSPLGTAGLREYSEFARTDEECKRLAQNRLNSIAMGLVSGEGGCVGIPELIAGRYLEIESRDPTVKGAYFLTKVRHRFTTNNYTTAFEFKAAKL